MEPYFYLLRDLLNMNRFQGEVGWNHTSICLTCIGLRGGWGGTILLFA